MLNDDIALGQLGEVGLQVGFNHLNKVLVTDAEGSFQLIDPRPEEANWSRDGNLRIPASGVHVKVAEVAPAIDDQKAVLLRAPGLALYRVVEQNTCTAADHLPELHVGVDRLGEHEIHYLVNVDACIEHVNRDGNARHVLVLELVQQSTLAVHSRIL